jgi:hypothetical protein
VLGLFQGPNQREKEKIASKRQPTHFGQRPPNTRKNSRDSAVVAAVDADIGQLSWIM